VINRDPKVKSAPWGSPVTVLVMVGIAGYEGITCALVFACLCLCSADVFLVLLPLFVLVPLVFAFAVVRLVSDERLSIFQAWRSFR
jgi:hypothetical protein